jgi:flagellar protein FlaG
MDVNTITNSLNLVNQYNNTVVSKADVTADTTKVSSIPKDTKNQENNGNGSNANANTDKQKMDNAINKLNKLMESDNTHAEYSVHKELGTTMIKIVDDKTKKVILELPEPEKVLDMIASMCQQAGLIDKKA